MTVGGRRSGLIVPERIDDVFDTTGSLHAIAVLRIVLGPITVIHLWPDVTAAWDGVSYLDHFNEPWFAGLPVAPAWIQYALVHVGVGAAAAMTVGWHVRVAAPLTAVCVTANLLLDQTHFRHNRAFLVFLLWTVAFSGDAARIRSGFGSLWPVWTMRVLASSVYFASGFSKLIDPDWVGGLVLWDRSVRYQEAVTRRVPGVAGEWLVEIVTTRWIHAVTSPVAVAVELFIAFGLWFTRTRIAAVWVAVFFHLSIEVSASVEVFSVAAVAALVIWTTPTVRDRVVTTPNPAWIARLDWLARFDIRPGDDWALIDRDGRRVTGRDARWRIAARLPATFMIAAPVTAVASRRRRRSDSSVR